ELVFDRYHRSLLAFCRRMLASDEEAEDALQHTFMAAYRALRGSDRPILLKAWLFTIARNRCLSILRARREQVALDDGHAASDGLAADVDRRAELRGLLADLEQLPEEQRAALVLFELGDHSHDEIAEVLGVRRDKVKALVFQARESLAGWRRARETPCVEIREQLGTARGAALKRAALRRHVARCEGCAEFDAEVRRQRSAMAMLLPVVPAAGLKAAVLGAAGIGAGAGAGAGAGGGSLAGLGAAKGLAAKTMLCAAVAGSAGSAGYVAVREVQMHDARGDVPATVSRSSHRAGAGPARGAQGARAAKPVVIAQAATPIVTATAAAAPKPSHVASGDRARYGGRHHRHDGFGGHGPRRAAAWDGHARREGSQRRAGRDGAQRHGFGRGDGSDRGDSGQRQRSAKRDGSARRDGSAQGADSGRGGARQRDRSTSGARNSRQRGDSGHGHGSAAGAAALRTDSAERDRSGVGAKSGPGTEG
ncbi:MAG: sigma-70 family RNA polymerase sigma factor, partial [Solirubrobacteraceae bacterium]